MDLFNEPIIEPLARWVRFRKGMQYIPKNRPLIILDVGCGPVCRFYHFAKNKIIIKKYIGIDPLIDENITRNTKQVTRNTRSQNLKQNQNLGIFFSNNLNIKLVKSPLTTTIPFPDQSVDIVVGFAVLEHVNDPEKLITESVRVLKKGGKAIFTTPTPRAKKVLEFLCFNLGLISKREIEEHKRYFNREMLKTCNMKHVTCNMKTKMHHEYFEWGMNNLFIIEK